MNYWDAARQRKHFGHHLPETILHSISPMDRILDYGCGFGRTIAELSFSGFGGLVGVDTSPGMIDQCKKEGVGYALLVERGRSLPFADGSFGLVVMLALLTCIVEDDEQVHVMNEAHRILRPGGTLFLSDYELQDDVRNLSRYQRHATEHSTFGVFKADDGAIFRHQSPQWLDVLLQHFAIIQREHVSVTTLNNHRATAIQVTARKG